MFRLQVLGLGGTMRWGGSCSIRRAAREREFFIDNLLVRIHFIVEMISWTGLVPWKFEFPFPGSLIPTFLSRTVIFGCPCVGI